MFSVQEVKFHWYNFYKEFFQKTSKKCLKKKDFLYSKKYFSFPIRLGYVESYDIVLMMSRHTSLNLNVDAMLMCMEKNLTTTLKYLRILKVGDGTLN